MVVGINGANGFIGYHLWVHIKYLCDDLEVIKLSRDLKEIEISELSKNQDNLKNEIDANRNDYESLVDKTTLELENFIKRNDPDIKTQ